MLEKINNGMCILVPVIQVEKTPVDDLLDQLIIFGNKLTNLGPETLVDVDDELEPQGVTQFLLELLELDIDASSGLARGTGRGHCLLVVK
jgi:hypothetical protein